jgi:UDP-N-acetylglucosamine 2-epimerase (non-hydrolysing)
MRHKIKVLTIFGTRPEAIKMAPLVKELQRREDDFASIVCVTAQHRSMLDQVLDAFKIVPQYDLNIMKPNQSLVDISVNALAGLESVIKEVQPDIVLVHGDTSTTFFGSLAAFYQQVMIGHVEAGLRTHNKYSPFPEEANRQLTGVLADLHFAPTEAAAANLLAENKNPDNIYVTGNTVIDSFATTVRENYTHPILEEIKPHRMVLVTAHRRENLGEPMTSIFSAIKRIVEEHEEISVVFPVHLNPRVQQLAQEILGHSPRVKLIEPLDVIDFHNFEARAHLILTDSGGLQEEAPSFGVPVLVLRNTTERPEGIAAGTLRLVGTNEQTIYEHANELLTNRASYEQMAHATNPYGDGKASGRIADILLQRFQDK